VCDLPERTSNSKVTDSHLMHIPYCQFINVVIAYQLAGGIAVQFQWPSWVGHCEATKFPSWWSLAA